MNTLDEAPHCTQSIGKEEDNSRRYRRVVPDQFHKSDFVRHFPKRENGWVEHLCVFGGGSVVEENKEGAAPSAADAAAAGGDGGAVFSYNDDKRGGLHVHRDGFWLRIEVWWKGTAPWKYSDMYLYRNKCFDETGLKLQVVPFDFTSKTDEDSIRGHNGHVFLFAQSKRGDVYHVQHKPAHVQGTPACFELRVSAYRPLPVATGEGIITLFKERVELYKGWKHIYCPNAAAHAASVSATSASTTTTFSSSLTTPRTCCCWSCKAPLSLLQQSIEVEEEIRCTREDQALFGPDLATNSTTRDNAAAASFERGVCVKWLEEFTTNHDCWLWPTWYVVENIIKPVTAEHNRCRYVSVPGVAKACKQGKADIYISHSWGGVWGDLVAAALDCCSAANTNPNNSTTTTRVYIDALCARQWSGNQYDKCFAGIIKLVKMVLVVVSSGELERIGAMNIGNTFKLESITPSERRSTPFLRAWVLAEISSACEQNKPLVISCGLCTLDRRAKSKYVFEHNTPLLYNLSYLVSIEKAETQLEEDRLMILDHIRNGIGIEEANRRVKGSIIGAMVASKSPALRYASVGDTSTLMKLLQTYYGKEEGAAIHAVIPAAEHIDDSSCSVYVSDDDDFEEGSKAAPSDAVAAGAVRTTLMCALCAAAACGLETLFDLLLSFDDKSKQQERLGSSLSLVNAKDQDGMTPLMHAARAGQFAILAKIIERCSIEDIDAQNADYWTALALSSHFGCAKAIELLLARGADPNIILGEERGPIAIAIGCQRGFSVACCQMLLLAGSDVEHRDDIGYTTLRHCLVPGTRPELVTFLLQAGANPNAVDNWGDSICISACYTCSDNPAALASFEALLNFEYSSSPYFSTTAETAPVSSSTTPRIEALDFNLVNVFKCTSPLDSLAEPYRHLLLRYGALTFAQMARRTRGGCGKLLESNVRFVMAHFGITREEAGLALSVYLGRLDWLLRWGKFPRPGDVVSFETAKLYEWGSGIVKKGKYWNYPESEDVTEDHVGYLDLYSSSDKARVTFPLRNESQRELFVSISHDGLGKFDLVYAPYRYPPCADDEEDESEEKKKKVMPFTPRLLSRL